MVYVLFFSVCKSIYIQIYYFLFRAVTKIEDFFTRLAQIKKAGVVPA